MNLFVKLWAEQLLAGQALGTLHHMMASHEEGAAMTITCTKFYDMQVLRLPKVVW